MQIVYSNLHEQHNPKHDIYQGRIVPYLETPLRASAILAEIQKSDVSTIVEPFERVDEHITDVHDPAIVRFLKDNKRNVIALRSGYPRILLDTDADESVSLSKGTYRAARAAASVALSGASILCKGRDKAVYALCRPPGHHATRDRIGGYCFFNNAAIAAKHLMKRGRVAVFDIDIHHGNGTQDIMYDDERAAYISINGEGAYPKVYDGRQSSVLNTPRIANLTAKRDSSVSDYLRLVDKCMDHILAWRADSVVVSAGFDTSENEEVSWNGMPMQLTRQCYHTIGRKLKATKLPILAVQEGGYNTDSLGKDVVAFLEGLD